MSRLIIPVILVGALTPGIAFSTDGALDSYGCHVNHALGTYHCHKGPFAGKNFNSKADMLEALKEISRKKRKKPKLESRL